MQILKRCWLQTLPRNKMFSFQVEKKMLKISRRQFNLLRNMLLQLATKKFWCVAIFDVGGKCMQQRFWTCKATMFRFKFQQFVDRITSQ